MEASGPAPAAVAPRSFWGNSQRRSKSDEDDRVPHYTLGGRRLNNHRPKRRPAYLSCLTPLGEDHEFATLIWRLAW